MLIDFFLHLKQSGLPVSTTEYLSLLEALSAGLANYRLDDFYTLSRVCLIKNEKDYDKFDVAFGAYFQKMSASREPTHLARVLPKEAVDADLSAVHLAMLESAFQTPEEDFRSPHDIEETHQDGSQLLVGSDGNSPFGMGGINDKNFRFEGESTGNRHAMKAWNSRQFMGLNDEVELGTRNIKMALRRLRQFTREGLPDELDLDETISSTARQGGFLDIKMRAARKNKVKVLILFDIGGSMSSHVKLCEELFSAVRTEFKHLEYFYFHNCVYDSVWRYNGPSFLELFPIHYLTNKFGKDFKLIMVGDASMSPVEILSPGEESLWQAPYSGGVWMRALLAHFKHAVWLNPEQEQYWHLTQSIQMVREIMENRMYPLTLAGLDSAMKTLNK
ncbi:MAG: VWA domain-containing protein [Burkholderiaceae bacterium]|jgi:uncharacterized protein with von Willebrand factor type A (vWA) domain|nr:VWA domain-containing protein [Burkholderiaceae bacterium]